MKSHEIQIGRFYRCKISGKLTTVKILDHGIDFYGRKRGWVAVNIHTGRTVRIKTAARLRREIDADYFINRLAEIRILQDAIRIKDAILFTDSLRRTRAAMIEYGAEGLPEIPKIKEEGSCTN